jgi:hypothetical protein
MFESVLLKIEIYLKIRKTPFADAHRCSQFKAENEFIVAFGTVFHIDTIEPMTETIWFVKLNSRNETDATILQRLSLAISRKV